jgi:arabinofuranosyltransferase
VSAPPDNLASDAPPWRRRCALALLVAATIFGAARLSFLCDDAFIHFRYALNAHAGHGLVWNAEPFRPVEGAGFLWILVLWAMQSWLGVMPHVAANPFLIACGVVQVLIVAAAAHRLCRRDGAPVPFAVWLCAMIPIVGNRTFLQWMTGGLDTALSNVFLIGWVLHAFRAREKRDTRWLAIWSALAAMAALVRPDGLPLVAATVGAAALSLIRRRRPLRATLAALSPLLLVAAHLLWRRGYYGDWLPNTYYAKVGSAWPESGWRYLACFALENGAWLWLPISAAWLVFELRRGARTVAGQLCNHVPAVAAASVAVFNVCYYTLKVGGDHFEYRVLAFLVPLGVLGCIAMAARMANGVRLPIATALALAIAGSAGWIHLALQSGSPTPGFSAVSPRVPAVLRPLARWFDRQQAWLWVRYVGLRVDHHRSVYGQYAENFCKPGEHLPQPIELPAEAKPFPIMVQGAVGLPSYWMPDCAIIDYYGLNDWVVARTPPHFPTPVSPSEMRELVARANTNGDEWIDFDELRATITAVDGTTPPDLVLRWLMDVLASEADRIPRGVAEDIWDLVRPGRVMAHEHAPPPGYAEAFQPNVLTVEDGVPRIARRRAPMTAERIRAIEVEWRQRVLSRRAGN